MLNRMFFNNPLLNMTSILPAAEWKRLRVYMRPGLFKVIPITSWFSQLNTLNKNQKNMTAAADVHQKLMNTWEHQHLLIKPKTPQMTSAVHLSADEARTLLHLFFHQFLTHDHIAIQHDLPVLFRDENGRLSLTRPRLWHRWDSTFIQAMREVYLGYYQFEDEQFFKGLKQLGLQRVSQEIGDVFGNPDMGVHTVTLEAFFDNFEDFFEACRRHGTRLHQDFLVLGLSLATVIKGLEESACPLDIRAVFLEAAHAR